MSIAGKLGAVYASNGGASTVFTGEAMTANATWTQYKITAAAKRFWDEAVPAVIKKNGATITTGFTIDYAGGVVNFNPALINTDVVTAGGNYFTVVQCATFFNWKLDVNLDLKDVTTFASNGWKEQFPTIKSWSGSADGYWADSTYLGLLGKSIILALYVDNTTNKRYEGYIYLKKNSITEAADDVVKEAVDIEGDGALYYHEI